MKGYRTFVIAGLIASVSALQEADWIHVLPSNPHAVAAILIGLSAIMAGLRAVTTTAPGKAQ